MQILVILLVIFGIIFFASGNIFVSLSIKKNANRKFILDKNKNPEGQEKSDSYKYPADRFLHNVEEDVIERTTISSKDKTLLHYYILNNNEKNAKKNKYVFLVHGFSGSHYSSGYFAKIFYDLGYSIITLDLRCHGKTQGKYVGMGILDAQDILDITKNFLKTHSTASIALFGVSMGGAAVLSSLHLKFPQNVKCVIADSSYTCCMDIFKYQLKNKFKLPQIMVYPANIVCKLRAGYFFTDYPCIKGVEKTNLPILFIHGLADTFVPPEMADRLYDACSSEKMLLTTPGAGHVFSAYLDLETYTKTCKIFLEQHLKNS